MPMITYEYECRRCGLFEVKRSIKEDKLEVCPTCGDRVTLRIPKEPPTVWWVGRPHLKDAGLM